MTFEKRSDYVRLLGEMYQSLFPQLKRCWGFHPWLVVRIQTGYFFHLIYGQVIKAGQFKNVSPPQLSKQAGIRLPFFTLYSAAQALYFWIKFKNRLKKKFLLVGSAKDVMDKKDYYNIYLHPFQKKLSEVNASGEVLMLDGLENRLFVVLYSLNNYWFKLISPFSKQNKIAHENAIKVYDYLKSSECADGGEISKIIYNTLRSNEVYFRTWLQFLKITRPKGIWIYNFYNNPITALIRAGNKLGLPTVEYQHSTQSDDHFAYASWMGINDYREQLPTTFWLWTKVDIERIKRNFYDEDYHPRLIEGGNLFLRQEKKRLSKGKGVQDKPNDILITLQGIWIPSFVEEAISKTSDKLWYFRLHPRYPTDKDKVLALKSRYPNQVEIELANTLQLYELLGLVSYHLTCFSGSAIEAMHFGVQNIIFGSEGFNTYEEFIKDGKFFFVEAKEDLIAIILDKPDLIVNSELGSEEELNSKVLALLADK